MLDRRGLGTRGRPGRHSQIGRAQSLICDWVIASRWWAWSDLLSHYREAVVGTWSGSGSGVRRPHDRHRSGQEVACARIGTDADQSASWITIEEERLGRPASYRRRREKVAASNVSGRLSPSNARYLEEVGRSWTSGNICFPCHGEVFFIVGAVTADLDHVARVDSDAWARLLCRSGSVANVGGRRRR